MRLTGLHLLLTYRCTAECEHCFVWGSPRQSGTMTMATIRAILRQASEVESIERIYFEGGEPFLYYPVLAWGVRETAAAGFRVGIVTNGFWATSVEDALEWLDPFGGLISDLSISTDLYHYEVPVSSQARDAQAAAQRLDIPTGVISVAQPEATDAVASEGQLPPGESTVMFRGRAAEKLASGVPGSPWQRFEECPHEDLREPGRVHVDPFGNLHICQGIVVGNLLRAPLGEICAGYDPEAHPIVGPLLAGGPAELARRYALPVRESYADACHLCYEARRALRERFADILAPDQMYGVPDGCLCYAKR